MNKTAQTGKLSQPMLDALEEIGWYRPFTGRVQTVKALQARGYVELVGEGEYELTEAGRANFRMYFGGDDVPATTSQVSSDDHIAEYLSTEDDETYPDRNYVPGDMTTEEYVNLSIESAPETTVEAVDGLTAYLDTPHVVPNRKERRGWRKVRAVFNRTRAKIQDRRVSENVRKENARKVRRGVRKASV